MYVIRESKKSNVNYALKKRRKFLPYMKKKTKQKHPGFFPRKKERSVVSENVGQASYKG